MLDNCKNRLPHCASRCQISTGWDWLACQLWSTVMMVEPRTLGVKVHPTTTKMKRTCWLADLENSMRPTILNSFWLLAARKWTRSWINMQQLKLSSITLSCDNQVKHCWHVWLNDFWRVQRSSWLKRVNTLKLGILEHERHTSLGRCSAKENATNFCKQSKGFVVKHFFYCLLNVGCCNNPWLKESHSINICHILCSHWHHSFHSWCIVLSAWFVPLICCAGFVHKYCFCLSFKFCGQTCWDWWHEPSQHVNSFSCDEKRQRGSQNIEEELMHWCKKMDLGMSLSRANRMCCCLEKGRE